MTNSRMDRYTLKTKQIEVYSDFPINFDLNPVTGFLAKVTNEDAIKQSLKTLILTQRTERFYDSSCGSRLYGSLFDPMEPATEEIIKNEIVETIRTNEPRVSELGVHVRATDNNDYNVTVNFGIINIPDKIFSMNLVLRRVR